NTTDADVVKYLKYFTLLGREEIAALEDRVRQAPESRDAQRKLAEECTRMVHGESALAAALQASKALFGEDVTRLPAHDIADIFADVPSKTISRDRISSGIPILDVMVETGIAPSKSEARRLIENGGFYLNNVRVSDPRMPVGMANTIEGRFAVLRKGAKGYL